MPLNEKQFDAQIRFVVKSDLKKRLYREAVRRHVSAADLIRLYIEEGLDRALVKTGVRPGVYEQGQNPVAVLQKRNRPA
jgi:hypothetical protein